MRFFNNSFLRRPLVREAGVFLIFCVLAVIMTWPYAYYIRDAVTDPGDPYLNAWLLWWDYHQTFHDPLRLFQAPLFYPYEYTLAFTEHSYGVALLFFPLQALGLRPLTVQAVATLLGFAFCGYGAFRLTRTLTGSNVAAWVAGVAFAFTPYRFHQMPHLVYVFAGWIPLLLEALILYARTRSWKRAAWLGLAFLLNALTCVHWFVLTLLPLSVSLVFLATRYRLWREARFWLRGGLLTGAAILILLPFMLPYQKVAQMYGMVRTTENAAFYSAVPTDWLWADWRSKVWSGVIFKGDPPTERALFPGLLPLLLALAALFYKRRDNAEKMAELPPARLPRGLLAGLDLLALTLLALAALSFFYGPFRLEMFGFRLLRVSHPERSLLFLGSTLLLRFLLAYPRLLRVGQDRNLPDSLRRWLTKGGAGKRDEGWEHGVAWLILGFAGSLGMNFFFHRLLFDYVFIFRSIRVPARWAMIACLGLSLLAGLGAKQLVSAWQHWRPQARAAPLCLLLCALLLFEAHIAPMEVVRGQADPDDVTFFLRDTPMRGGVAHLPVAQGLSNHRYTLRQADHQKPLITALSGFAPPLEVEIEDLWQQNPVPERLLDALESAPASYLVIHWYTLPPARSEPLRAWVERGVAAGRLRLARSFPVAVSSEDVYAVTKTEPEAQ